MDEEGSNQQDGEQQAPKLEADSTVDQQESMADSRQEPAVDNAVDQREPTADNTAEKPEPLAVNTVEPEQALSPQEQSTKQEEPTTVSEPASPDAKKATEDVTTVQGPERSDQESQSSTALKPEITSGTVDQTLKPTLPAVPSSGAATSSPPAMSPRPQSFAAQGSATLPIRGPLRPISTVIGDTPSEQFDSLYDTLPVDLRGKKSKSKDVAVEPLPTTTAAVVNPVVDKPQDQPTDQLVIEASGEEGKQGPVFMVDSQFDDHPNNHRILTIISMVLCGVILNVFAFSCLIPAFIFSKKSQRSAEDGDYKAAKKHARTTLILNFIAVIGTVIGLLALLIITQIIFGSTVY